MSPKWHLIGQARPGLIWWLPWPGATPDWLRHLIICFRLACVFHDPAPCFAQRRVPIKETAVAGIGGRCPFGFPAFSQPSLGDPEGGQSSSHPQAASLFPLSRQLTLREAEGTEKGRSLEKTFPVGQRLDTVVCQHEIWEAVGTGSWAVRKKVSGTCRLFFFFFFLNVDRALGENVGMAYKQEGGGMEVSQNPATTHLTCCIPKARLILLCLK